MMKEVLHALIALPLLLVQPAWGQPGADSEGSGDPASNYRTDFTIPQIPALSLLGTDPSTLLRPSSLRDLSLAFQDFLTDDGSFRLPNSIGVEFAPLILAGGGRLSVQDYRNKAVLYRTRISIGANDIQSGADIGAFGIGMRVTLKDDSDLRTSAAFISEATELAKQITDLLTAKRLEFGPTGPSLDEIQNMPEVADAIQELQQAHMDKWANRRWNARIDELAVAWSVITSDSGADAKSDKLAIWYTSSFPVKTWGQWIVGARGSSEHLPDLETRKGIFSLSTRLYVGSNKIKAFAEAQGTTASELRPSWFAATGGEARVRDNMWFDFSVGAENSLETGTKDLKGEFALRLGLWAFPIRFRTHA